jgi:P22_AR N-terminal domain
MPQEQVLTPRAERLVNFHGDQITVALVGEDEPYVPLRTLAEYLGLEWSSQYRRVQRDSVLARSIRTLIVHGADGKLRDMLCLPLDKLAGWLFGLTVSKVGADLAPRLELYREECFKVLWREFQSDVVQRQQPTVMRSPLAQVREMGLAIAQLAEQQMALEGQVEYIDGTVTVLSIRVDKADERLERTDERLDRAAQIVGQLQQRLGTIERKLEPGAHVTDEQAAEISNKVKALAQFLSQKDPTKNHYQAIFGELYRRFRVSSYKLIPQNRQAEVLAFLDDWLKGYDTFNGEEQNAQ